MKSLLNCPKQHNFHDHLLRVTKPLFKLFKNRCKIGSENEFSGLQLPHNPKYTNTNHLLPLSVKIIRLHYQSSFSSKIYLHLPNGYDVK